MRRFYIGWEGCGRCRGFLKVGVGEGRVIVVEVGEESRDRIFFRI